MITGQQYIMAWRQHVDSSFALCCHASSREEVDTKIIFHAIKAKERGATQLDVFILLIRRHPQLPEETSFVTCRGTQQRRIQIKKIYDELGPAKQMPCQDFMRLRELTLQGLWRERKVAELENIQPSR